MIPYYVLDTIDIGSLSINVWGLFAGLAFAAALAIALKEAKRPEEKPSTSYGVKKNISEETIWDLAVLILAGGVIGARLAFVLENWDYFSKNQSEIFSLRHGGLMFYGGAFGAVLLVAAYIKFINPRLTRFGREKLSLASIADTLAPSFAIGEFIGRIGCSITDLHIGFITALPWGQKYIDGSIRHPTAIYMSLNGLAMFIVFWFLRTKARFEGALFLFFVLWYSGTRFFLDFLRCSDLPECDPRYWGFTPSQYLSAGVFIFTLIFLILIIRRLADKKHMADQQKEFYSKEGNGTGKNEKVRGSAVSFTKVEEIIIEGGAGEKISKESKSGGSWKDKLKFNGKKSWMIALLAIGAAVIGAGAASAYYAGMFKKPIFAFHGKTWISYDEPIVGLKIVNDKNCAKCDASDIVKQIKSGVIPTLASQEIDYNSPEGKKLIETFKIKSLPALIFDANIEKAAIFEKIKTVVENKNSMYYLSSSASGIPPGKFLELPKISAEDRSSGSEPAPVTIIEFSDFKCPYCKAENDVVKQVLSAYPDKVRLVFKHLPLPIHPESQFAAEAAECAGDQGKFWEMADALFAKQDKLDKDSIAKYARDLKLDAKKFKDCVDSGKFKSKIENDGKTAAEFGITGTPAFFVGDEFLGGALPFEQFKEIIDAKLAK